MLSTSRPLNEKTIDDGKEKPQSIKFYNFTKGGTDIVDQLNAYYTTRAKSCRWVFVALSYMLDISRVNVLETQRRYFKVLIIKFRMESCQGFSITSCSQTKIALLDVNSSVEDENVPPYWTRSL